jgi:sugar phosphate permease
MFIYTFGIFAKPLAAAFNGSRASISMAILLLNAMVAFTSPMIGYAVDRYGGRRVITASVLALSLCLFGLSAARPPLWHLYALYIAAGIAGTGSSPVAYSRVIANWFDRDRGLALGLASAGIGVGALILPSVTQFVIQNYGWRQAYGALGCLSLVLAAPMVGAFLRGTPQELGLLPDGVQDARGSSRLATNRHLSGLVLREAVRTPTFWTLCLIFYAVSACVNGTLAHLVPLLTDRGMDAQKAAATVSLFGAATVLGRIGNGYLADRFFAPHVAAAVFGGAATGVALLWQGATGNLVYFATFIMGLALGAEADLMPYLVSRYFGMRAMGSLLGCIFTAYTLGAGSGPFLIGVGFDATGSYRVPLTFAFPVLALATLSTLFLGKYQYVRSAAEPVVAGARS